MIVHGKGEGVKSGAFSSLYVVYIIMSNETLIAERPPLTVGPSGSIRVTGTRVQLEIVIAAYNDGYSVEEISSAFPTVGVADAYSVVGYYLHHKDEIDDYCKRQRRAADDIRATIESNIKTSALRERLKARDARVVS